MEKETWSRMDLGEIGRGLKDARERAELSQEAAAEAAGLNRVVLAYYEIGERQPSLSTLAQLARLYGLSLAQLLGEAAEEPGELDFSEILFRAAPATLAEHPRAGILEFSALGRSYNQLLQDVGRPIPGKQKSRFSAAKPRAGRSEAGRLAREVREVFGLGDGPLGDHLFSVFDEHVLAFRLSLGVDLESSPSGLFCNHREAGFCVLVNSDMTLGRQLFTLAHELAHAFFHSQEADVWISFTGSAAAREKFADYFAAELLVPGDALARAVDELEAWEELSDPVLAVQLQRHFGVSYGTLLFRMRQERMITPAEYAKLKHVSPSKLARALGYDVHPADLGDYRLPPIERLPGRMLRLMRSALVHGVVTRGDAAETLGVSTEEVLRLLEQPKASAEELRAVDAMEQVARLGD